MTYPPGSCHPERCTLLTVAADARLQLGGQRLCYYEFYERFVDLFALFGWEGLSDRLKLIFKALPVRNKWSGAPSA